MESNKKLNYIFNLYKKAYGTLEKSCLKKDSWKEEIEILNDSIIQRFEYTYELSWKTLKYFLEDNGIITTFPREIYKESYKKGLIDNLDIFFDFIDIRNKLSHTYSEYSSQEAVEYITSNYTSFEQIINNIDKISTK